MAWLTTEGKSWKRRVRLTFTGWSGQNNVDDYPILVHIDPSKTAFWDAVADDRNDFRFTLPDGTTLLKHFALDGLYGFNHSTDNLYAFVESHVIDATTDYIYLYWGLMGGGAPNVEDEAAVFDTDVIRYSYAFDQASGHFHDSGRIGRDSIVESGITRGQAGLSGPSTYLDGDDYVRFQDMYGHGRFSVIAVYKHTAETVNRCLFSMYRDDDNWFRIYTYHTGYAGGVVLAEFDGNQYSRSFSNTVNQWNIITVTKEYDKLRVSINGGAYSDTEMSLHQAGITFDHAFIGAVYDGSIITNYIGYVDMLWVTYGRIHDDWVTTNNDNFKEKDFWSWTAGTLDGAPNPPQSPWCEGTTNPQNVYDREPEFSAIFDDINTDDTSDYYQIQIATDQAFGSLNWESGKQSMETVNEGSRCADIEYGGPGLQPNVTYYWRIRFWDAADSTGEWSATQNFLCPNSAPTAPTSLLCEGATNPTNVYDPTPEFSAIYNDPDPGDYACYYRLQVDDDSEFGSLLWDSGQTSISPLLEGTRCVDIHYAGTMLAPNTTYYWRIKFWDDEYQSTEGAWSTETATFYCPNTAPSAPITLWCNGEVNPQNLKDYTPYFSAIGQDPEDGNPDTMIYYRLQVDDDPAFGTTIWDSGKTAIASFQHNQRCSNIEYAGSTPSKDTTYYWRIKFWDDSNVEGAWSSNANFKVVNSAPTAPTLLLCEGEHNPNWVTDATPEFSAIGWDIDPADQMNYYWVVVDTDPEFGNPFWSSAKQSVTAFDSGERCADISYGGQTLQDDIRYYWRIHFYDDHDGGTQGAWSTEVAWFIVRSGTPPVKHIVEVKDVLSADSVELTGDSVTHPFTVNSIEISPLRARMSRILGSDPESQYEDRELKIEFNVLDKSGNKSPDDVLDAIGRIRRLLSLAENNEWAGLEQSVRLRIWPSKTEFPSYWPIKKGWVVGFDPVDDLIAATGEANDLTLHLITTPWGRGCDIEQPWLLLRCKGGNQASFTISPVTIYNHNDDHSQHDNFIDIPPGDVQGDVPSMVELEVENHADSPNDIYQINIGHRAGSESPNFAPTLNADDGTVGTDTTLVDDTTAPGDGGTGSIGRKASCTFATVQTYVDRLSWAIPAASIDYHRGAFRIYAALYSSGPNVVARMKTSLATGSAFYGEDRTVDENSNWPVIDMGIFYIPPEYISRFEDAPSLSIAIQAKRATGSDTLSIGYIILFPLNWPHNYLLGRAASQNEQCDQSEYVMHVSQKSRMRMFVESSGRLYQHQFRSVGQNMYFRPGQEHRIFILRGYYDTGKISHGITDKVTVRVRHNPRFSLTRS